MLTVLAAGSHRLTAAERQWTEDTLDKVFAPFDPPTTSLIHGYAWGVDREAARAAERRVWSRIEGFNADWSKGLGGGYKRNAAMIEELNQRRKHGFDTLVIVLFPKGVITPGTLDTCHRAVRNGHRIQAYGLDAPASLLLELASTLELAELDASMVSCYYGPARKRS